MTAFHRQRATKIVATLGPSSTDPDVIRQLFKSGVDVFRLNASHGDHADHQARYNIIRDLEKEFNRPIGVLLDLQGPKLRIGTFAKGPVTLQKGQKFALHLKKVEGDETKVSLPHPEIFDVMAPGLDLLVNDGRIHLKVTEVADGIAMTIVEVAGLISDRKGVNVPGAILPISPLTPKDRDDLAFGLDLGVDWVALSFVQHAEDLELARQLIGTRAGLLAKLEKPAAIDSLDAIVDKADAIMVARGDLGVELPPEKVPGIQKRIVSTCREKGKPVIVATQMLESMIESPTPTRAEASDVSTAIYDGADAVMLSAETAAGEYPIEAVSVMNRIILSTESDPYYRATIDSIELPTLADNSDAIAAAASDVARARGCKAITTFTSTGSTTIRAARMRSPVPILGLTPTQQTARKLTLVWGVHSVKTKDPRSFGEMVGKSTRIARREGFVEDNDHIVVTAGVPFGTPGTTNVLRIARVGEHEKHNDSE